jgi:hypothetical protein
VATKAELEKQILILETQLEALSTYKERVRQAAIEAADEQGWCKSGLNEVLEELDLRKVPDYMRREAIIKVKYIYDPDSSDGFIARLGLLRQNGTVDMELEIEEWSTEYDDPEEVYE